MNDELKKRITKHYDDLLDKEYIKLDNYFKRYEEIEKEALSKLLDVETFKILFNGIESSHSDRLEESAVNDTGSLMFYQAQIDKTLAAIGKLKVDKHWIVGD